MFSRFFCSARLFHYGAHKPQSRSPYLCIGNPPVCYFRLILLFFSWQTNYLPSVCWITCLIVTAAYTCHQGATIIALCNDICTFRTAFEMKINFRWAHPSPPPKRHLDQFSRFCTAHYGDRPTGRQTDHSTRSVAIGRIYVTYCDAAE